MSRKPTLNSKPHSIPHVLSRVFGCPLLIDPAKAEVIANVVLARAEIAVANHPAAAADTQQQSPQASYLSSERQERKPYEVVNSIAIIDISGALVNRSSGMDAWSGLTAYEQLNYEVADAASDPNIKGILLRMDSPGGEVHGVFDLADSIVKASTIKPTWASVDDQAYSAGYLLASACSRIFVTRTSGVGSIGVVAMRLDVTKMDADMGVRFNFIYAGERKVDNNPHTEFTDPAEAAIRTEIDRIYGMFCGFVAKQRGLKVQAVKDTQAGLISGPDAIKLKLADELGTFPQAFAALSKETEKQGTGAGTGKGLGFSAASALAAASAAASAAKDAEEDDDGDDAVPADPPATPAEPPEDEECKKKKKSMGDLQAATESTTLPFAQNQPVVESGDDNQRKDNLMSQTTDTDKPAETNVAVAPAAAAVTTAPATATALPPAPSAAPAAPTASSVASLAFVMDMCEIAGFTDTATARRIHSLNLDEAGVRRKLIEEKTKQASAADVTSHITPRTSSAQAGRIAKAEQFEKMAAEAKSLAASAPVSGPKLTYHQHLSRLMEANPAVYDEYLWANPAQCVSSGE